MHVNIHQHNASLEGAWSAEEGKHQALGPIAWGGMGPMRPHGPQKERKSKRNIAKHFKMKLKAK